MDLAEQFSKFQACFRPGSIWMALKHFKEQPPITWELKEDGIQKFSCTFSDGSRWEGEERINP